MVKSKKLAAGLLLAGVLAVAVLLSLTVMRAGSRLLSAGDKRITLVLVDKAIANQDELLSPLLSSPSIRIEKFSADDRSLSALGSIAAKYHDVESIHILSHGRKGVLQLSNQNLDANSLSAARPAFDKLARALASDGEVFLYGCDIGAGEEGAELVDNLAKIIGHRVAASTNETGAAKLGGDWVLERQSAPMHVAALDLPQWNNVLAENNTGAWTVGTNTGSNSITVGSSTVTATVTMSGFSTATTAATISQQTFNTIPVFTPAIQGTPSLGIVYTWDTVPEAANILASDDGGTEVMTIDFSAPVKDPILHIDRIGGSSNGQQNGSMLTLLTSGVSLTRLSGTPHFSVSGNVITNSQIGQPTGGSYTAESSTDITNGTASGSIQLNGTFTSVSFLLAPGTNALEGTGADAIEVGLTYDPLPNAVADALSGYVNTTLNANLFADNGSGADNDFNTDSLTIDKINGAAFTVGTPIVLSNGSLTVTDAATGDVTFVPSANFTSTETFDYTISDANGGTSTATVTITIQQTTVTLTNTSLGGVGGFTFTGGNGWSSQTLTTTTPGVGVSGAAQTLTAPATATTITESIPAGYSVTAISCSGLGSGTATPNLGAGSVVLDAAATAAGNSVACSFTNSKTPTAKFQVTTLGSVGGPFAFSAPSNLASAPGNITTVAVNTPTPSSPSAINISTIGSSVQLTETPASGYVVSSVSCTDANSAITGNSGSFGSLAGNVLTIPSAKVVAGADFTCILANTKTLSFKLQVSTAGGFGGAFSFTQTNLAAAPANITTTAATTPAPASPSGINVLTVGTAITVTATPPSGFDLTGASCTDANSAVTNNTGTFGSFASNVLTVAASSVVAGADITCVLSSDKLATLTLMMKSNGGTTGFTFTGGNGWSSQTITTVTAGTGVTGATQILTAVSTATTVTQSIPSGYIFSGVSCTGLGSGSVTPTLGSGAMLFNAAATAPGNAIACTVTDDKNATISLGVISLGGTGNFSFNSGTNVAITSGTIPTVTDGVTAPSPLVPVGINALGTAITFTEAPASGFALTSFNCTDNNSAVNGNTGNFGSFTGNAISISSGNVAAGGLMVCTATFMRPRVRVQKITLGGSDGPFTFSATNLASTPSSITTSAVNTATPASPTPINVSTVGSAVTITEPAFGGYSTTAASCTDANAAITGNSGSLGTLSGTTLTLPAGTVKAGADFTCVFTNTKSGPSLSLVKTASSAGPFSVGQTITYTYKVTNTGNVAVANIVINDSHNGSGSLSGPANEVIFADVSPTGDSTDVTPNDGTWSSLGPGDTVSFTASYVVTQHDVDYLQ